MTQEILGRPVREALSSLSPGDEAPRVVETAAPKRGGAPREAGQLRVVACREGVWIAARFLDGAPRKKEEV